VKNHPEVGRVKRDFVEKITGASDGDQGVQQSNPVECKRDSQPKY
jgi:hypothetical protein